ncbi:hypothetical protein ACFSNC_25370 [Ancylobacter oerskovii]|uniref:Uncharacterized protein n=1 Tax=Ancylobacter oerskovii TaxID=459519 RepID=A0ABW4Z595_9HYPH|nr:hypothetical protein [Ancylobacter oerskovii]
MDRFPPSAGGPFQAGGWLAEAVQEGAAHPVAIGKVGIARHDTHRMAAILQYHARRIHALKASPSGPFDLERFLGDYLSVRHRDNPDTGCPTAAMAAAARHQSFEACAAVAEAFACRSAGSTRGPALGQ